MAYFANIDRLNHAGASGGDKLHLNTEVLDCVDDASHLVDRKRVQEENGDDFGRNVCDVRLQYDLDPIKHDVDAEPCLFLAAVDETGREGGELLLRDVPILLPCETKTISMLVNFSID